LEKAEVRSQRTEVSFPRPGKISARFSNAWKNYHSGFPFLGKA
jgi:hypothetical protein